MSQPTHLLLLPSCATFLEWKCRGQQQCRREGLPAVAQSGDAEGSPREVSGDLSVRYHSQYTVPHHRKHEVTNMSLHFSGVGGHPRLFEALAAMLSRSALNPADISTVSEREYTPRTWLTLGSLSAAVQAIHRRQ